MYQLSTAPCYRSATSTNLHQRWPRLIKGCLIGVQRRARYTDALCQSASGHNHKLRRLSFISQRPHRRVSDRAEVLQWPVLHIETTDVQLFVGCELLEHAVFASPCPDAP